MHLFNIKWLIIAVVFTIVVFIFSHMPIECKNPNCSHKTADHKDQFTWEKVTQLQLEGSNAFSHVLAYGAITVLFTLSVKSFPSLRSGVALFFIILAIGTVDELTQPFFSRTANATDWLVDLLSIATALTILAFLKKSFSFPSPQNQTAEDEK